MKVGLYNTAPMLGLLPPPEIPQRENRYCSSEVLTSQDFETLFQGVWLETLSPAMIFYGKEVMVGKESMSKYGINCKNVQQEKATASCTTVAFTA